MALVPAQNLPFCTHRYIIFASYLGTKYNGSQRLIARDSTGVQDTVQEAIECSLESFLPKKRCVLTSASRTDKGVHALMNCFSLPLMDFDRVTPEKMKYLANINLAKNSHEVIITDVILGSSAFHPRCDALSREYIYRLAVLDNIKLAAKPNRYKPIELLPYLGVTELYRILPVPCFDPDKALAAMDLLRGEHDFESFASDNKDNPQKNTIRNLELSLEEVVDTPIEVIGERAKQIKRYQFLFKSKSFLTNQVRRMVGAIISYASYDRANLSDIRYLLDNPSSKNWKRSMVVAEPWGLYLKTINYNQAKLYGDQTVDEVIPEDKEVSLQNSTQSTDDQLDELTSSFQGIR